MGYISMTMWVYTHTPYPTTWVYTPNPDPPWGYGYGLGNQTGRPLPIPHDTHTHDPPWVCNTHAVAYVWRFIREEEDVGDIMEANKFHNITLLIRLIHQIRKCHLLEQCHSSLIGMGSQLVCG